MATVVQHNIGAQLALGELNKNISKVGKLLSKVSSGQKINSAQDDSASFCISEKMREQIRSLLQADQNVQNGSALLKTAESGIQQQIDIIRTIREKVIDADNDTNTDEDRKIIQKEIDQFYRQIDQIAYETDYNTHKPLLGNTIKDEIIKQIPYLEKVKHHLMPGDPGLSGDLNIVKDVYMTLDDLTGPFDQFKDYGIGNTTIKSLGITSALKIEPNGNYYTATPYEYAYINSNSWTKITSWGKAADSFMNNRGFYVSDGKGTINYYVLTNNPGVNTYKNSVTEIDISGCTSVAQVMAKIDDELGGVTNHSGNKLTIKKDYTLYGFQEFTSRTSSSSSAVSFGSSGKFSGAKYVQKWYPGTSGSGDAGGTSGYYGKDYSLSSDGKVTGSCSVSSLKNNSGFTVYNGSGGEVGVVRFVSGPLYSDADTTQTVGHQIGNDGVTEVSIAYLKSGGSVSFSTGSISVSITSSGSVTLTASPWSTSDATAINSYTVKNGISASSTSSSVRVRPLNFEKQAAEVSIDLSKYQTTNSATLEAFISDLAGKALKDNSYGNGNLGSKNSYTNSTNGWYYEFIDSASTNLSKNRSKIYQSEIDYNVGVTQLDLNLLRDYVNNNGMKIADAFYLLLKTYTGSENLKDDDGEDVLDDDGNVKTIAKYFPPTYNVDGDESSGVQSISVKPRNITNNNSTIAPVQGVLRHYDLDFNDWFNEHEDLVYYDLVSEYLDGKGFRAFCATDSTEWFNFIFRDGEENFVDEESFDSGTNIHTIQIDVSKVKSAADMVKAIYEQSEPELQDINHNFHLKLGSSGVVTIYDIRPLSNYFYAQSSRYANFQTGSPGTYMNGNAVSTTLNSGAKIADGIIESDEERDVWEKVLKYREEPLTKTLMKKLIIQDTNKASMNLRIQIPQTTLSNIFYPLPKDNEPFEYKDSIFNYTVLTKENRMLLLGDENVDPPVEGILDIGLNNLLDAAVLVGAQNARLEHTKNNLTTMVENVQASESTIRDADMAKEMTEYTKMNVISQASQAMLAQANQNTSSVLNLLQ